MPSKGLFLACITTAMMPPIDWPAPITADGVTAKPPVSAPVFNRLTISPTTALFAAATVEMLGGSGRTLLSPTER